MHSYDLEGRTSSLVRIAVLISVLLAGLDRTVGDLDPNLSRWLLLPSFGLTFAVVRAFVDHVGWRWKPARMILGISVTDVGGTWKGTIRSSYEPPDSADPAPLYPTTVTIQQTWMRVFVRLQTKASHSDSIAAAWRGIGTADAELTYIYENDPGIHASGDMQKHRGTTVLRLGADGDELIGEYYSGRGRQQYGELRLRRVSHRVKEAEAG